MLHIQERDLSLFKALLINDFLSKPLLLNYFEIFSCSDSALNRRLKKLTSENYIGFVVLLSDSSRPYLHLYYLKEKGYTLIGTPYKRKSIPKNLFLLHLTRLIECGLILKKVAYTTKGLAYKWRSEREFITTKTGKRLRATQDYFFSKRLGKKVHIIADATLVLQIKTHKMLYFIELDNATESIRGKLIPKFLKYIDYYLLEEKRFQKRFGVNSNGFRLLFITTSQRRIHHIHQALKTIGALSFVLFTTLDQLKEMESFTDPIWERQGRENITYTGLLK